jgi:DNA-binding PadR family transcriptional regulator
MTGNNVQMFILGSLTQGEAHGYQLLARAGQWGVDKWAGFSAGSIYNALRTLEKRGLIVRSGTEQHGGYAPATVFAITDEGRAELLAMIRSAATELTAHDPFDLVTAFLGLLPVSERKELIEAHVASLRQRRQAWEPQYEHMQEHVAKGLPYDWVLATLEKDRRVVELMIESTQELVTRSETWGPPEPLSRYGDADAAAAAQAVDPPSHTN